MALSRTSIKLMRQMMNDSANDLRYVNVTENVQRLQKNANYMAFVKGTDKGAQLNEKLLKLEKIANNVASDIAKIIKTTNSFLDEQERHNSAIDYSSDPRFTAGSGGGK